MTSPVRPFKLQAEVQCDSVLREQLAYYGARATEYDQWWNRQGRYDRGPDDNAQWFRDAVELDAALDAFNPGGRILELAAGTGIWSEKLLSRAEHLTLVDGSSEMLAINAARLSRNDPASSNGERSRPGCGSARPRAEPERVVVHPAVGDAGRSMHAATTHSAAPVVAAQRAASVPLGGAEKLEELAVLNPDPGSPISTTTRPPPAGCWRHSERVPLEASAIPVTNAESSGVEHIQTELFSWEPTGQFDVVFFGFWLSHVPPEWFDEFWHFVRRCLAPGGRFFFVDSRRDASSTAIDHRLPDHESIASLRRLNDGREFHVCKVFYDPCSLQARLAALGWECEVRETTQYFIYGHGSVRSS